MSHKISIDDVFAARERIAPYLTPTPLRHYPSLDRAVSHGIEVWVKHENHQPTNAFKVRNALSVMTRLSEGACRRGVVAATRGNHGQGVAWAGSLLGVPVTICVPEGNNPEKNEAMVDLGAELIVSGADYDESVEVAEALVVERGLTMVHSTNNADIIAGAATITLEMLEQRTDLDALVVAVGGGSQAAGAIRVVRSLQPDLRVYAVQAEAASASHDSWHAGEARSVPSADTFADGLATRNAYEATLPTLIDGLTDFVTVSEEELAEALRVLLRTTHTLVEGAGAAGFAGLVKLASRLAGQRVGVIVSGGNIDADTLRWVVR